MHRRGALVAERFEIVRTENVQLLGQHHASGRRRRKRIDVEFPKRDSDRRAPDRLVLAKIAQRKNYAGRAARVDDTRGDLAVVKIGSAVVGNALQRRGQLFLDEWRFDEIDL